MRLDSDSDSSVLAKFWSSLVTIAAIAVFGLIAWKAFDTWRSDPAVKGIEQIMQEQQK